MSRAPMKYHDEDLWDEQEDDVRVQQTEVGLGVFAAREFFPNEAIGHVLGAVVCCHIAPVLLNALALRRSSV